MEHGVDMPSIMAMEDECRCFEEKLRAVMKKYLNHHITGTTLLSLRQEVDSLIRNEIRSQGYPDPDWLKIRVHERSSGNIEIAPENSATEVFFREGYDAVQRHIRSYGIREQALIEQQRKESNYRDCPPGHGSLR